MNISWDMVKLAKFVSFEDLNIDVYQIYTWNVGLKFVANYCHNEIR